MKTSKMIVDLDDWGEQTLDFGESADISTDFTAELLKQAAQYDYFDGVLNKLRLIHSQKKLYLEKFTAEKFGEIEANLKEAGEKATVKAIESAVAEDEELYNLKAELLVLQNQMDRLRGHLGALGHKHSNLKELSRRERWNLSMSNPEVEEDEKEMPKREPRKGRKRRDA